MIEQFYQLKTISNNCRLIVIIFSLAMVILLIIGLVIFLPSAEVILQVRTEPYIGEFQITINQSVKEPIYNLETIPASIRSFKNNWSELNSKKYQTFEGLADQPTKRALVFSRDDLNNLINQKLNGSANTAKVVIGPDVELTEVKIGEVDLEDGWARLRLSVNTKVVPDYKIYNLKEYLTNKSKIEAISYLKSLPNVQDAKIKNWFNISSRLPSLSQRIKIGVDTI